jgi:hypothetical protein
MFDHILDIRTLSRSLRRSVINARAITVKHQARRAAGLLAVETFERSRWNPRAFEHALDSVAPATFDAVQTRDGVRLLYLEYGTGMDEIDAIIQVLSAYQRAISAARTA